MPPRHTGQPAVVGPLSNPTTSRVLSPFFTVNAMFFMGLFFLIAGYFVPRSFERKGWSKFIKGRFVRLGIPALFVAWFIFAPIFYLLQDQQLPLPEYLRFLYGTGWAAPYMHLWFLLHLILYSLVYVLWRQIRKRQDRKESVVSLPTHSTILLFVYCPGPGQHLSCASGIPLTSGCHSSM